MKTSNLKHHLDKDSRQENEYKCPEIQMQQGSNLKATLLIQHSKFLQCAALVTARAVTHPRTHSQTSAGTLEGATVFTKP